MPDVQLNINVKPKFPNCCVVCSGAGPDSSVVVGDLMVGWFSFFTDIPEGWGQVNVPVHSGCRKPFRLRRWLTRLCWFGLTFAIWWLSADQIEAWLPEPIQRLGRKLILVVLLTPFLLNLWGRGCAEF